jgi:hypothetical protein
MNSFLLYSEFLLCWLNLPLFLFVYLPKIILNLSSLSSIEPSHISHALAHQLHLKHPQLGKEARTLSVHATTSFLSPFLSRLVLAKV